MDKLTFESVPEECWFANLRSVLSPSDWDRVRKDAYRRSGFQCSVCGKKGRLEAHEKWEYDEERALQTLKDVVALCPDCHSVKHISRTYLVGKGEAAMEHFMRINGCSQIEYHEALRKMNEEYLRRNKVEGWITDISWLKNKYNIELR